VLWTDGKKIDTAFRRLRERRQAVGLEEATETPEQEQLRIQKDIATAQAAGDIATVLRIITKASRMTSGDFIKKTCGGLLFLYYAYIDKLHTRPVDVEDMIDGLLYLDARTYIIKGEMENK